MNPGRRRDRLVYFRVSEEEFEQMLEACETRGARSISDLARTAVQELLRTPKMHPEQHMIESLTAAMHELKQSVQRLTEAAMAEPGSMQSEEAGGKSRDNVR